MTLLRDAYIILSVKRAKKKTTKYKDEYERQILEHEEGEKYKIVKLEVDGMPAYLAAIYDPTSIKVEVTR